MRTMASSLLSSVKSHPLIIASSVLLLFVLPIFHMLVFFWPLIVSTVLGVLAVVSFGRQSDDHAAPTARCDTAETAWQQDVVAFLSHEEKISNVLMVGNQEVTWLEWLHNEDTRKLCAQECEPAVWDADGCDSNLMASSEASDVPPSSRATADASTTGKQEVLDDASLQAKVKGGLYACGSKGDGPMPVGALVSTEDDETAAELSSTVLDGVKGTDITLALEDLNREEVAMKASISTADNKTNLHSTVEVRMCTINLELTRDGENNTHALVCAEVNKDQRSVEGLCQTGGGVNECKTIHAKDGVSGYASAGEDDVEGISGCTNNCDIVAKSLTPTTDIKGTLDTRLGEDETSVPYAVSKPAGESGLHALEFPPVTEAMSHTSEHKMAHAHEQDALYTSISNEDISVSSEMKDVKVHKMQGTDEQVKEGRVSNQLVGPQWDMSDGEEDRSSLRFSFFHNNSLTLSEE